jgi:glucose-1-phosphate adenylyltransferase
MGIYIFNKAFLLDTLRADNQNSKSSHDFGKDLIPALIKTNKVMSYRFGGKTGRVTQDAYWRDVGTIDAFYQANMDLLKPVPPLDLYQKNWPIRSYQRQTPPARTVPGESGTEGICINSIVAGGVVISGGSVQQSVLFPNVNIQDEAFVVNSILFSGVKIGKGSQIQNAIIDKGVVIPAGMKIGFDAKKDAELFTLSDKGVAVVSIDTKFD